jgi:hypothetical protein
MTTIGSGAVDTIGVVKAHVARLELRNGSEDTHCQIKKSQATSKQPPSPVH